MSHRTVWQGDYRPSVGSPSPLSAIEIALKRLERFERLERLERTDPRNERSEAVERLERFELLRHSR
jgi:hypothetical protein